MLRATWRGVTLAEAPRTVRLEGNHYFPPESLRREHFLDSPTRTLCLWKGIARYHTVAIGDEVHVDAAWYYPHPSPLARRIKNHVAFGGGVRVEGTPEPSRRDGVRRRGLRRLLGGAR